MAIDELFREWQKGVKVVQPAMNGNNLDRRLRQCVRIGRALLQEDSSQCPTPITGYIKFDAVHRSLLK